ncbi:MAG: helix-turn-helix transcriptional regulator [Burkholderiaceae bacterium]
MRTQPSVHWQGQAWLRPGVGVFAGTSGGNDRHAHHAHQMTVARSGMVTVEAENGRIEGPGVFVPSGRQHQLRATGEVISIFVDPLFLAGREGMTFPAQCEEVDFDECTHLLNAMTQMPNLQPLIDRLLRNAEFAAWARRDERWPDVWRELLELAARGELPSRARLARLACLSPSRFSHWFVEQAGLPLRAYRKWLRLLAALSAVATGKDLTTAAHASGFADASHLSRTFRAMFGIDPSTALARLEWQDVPDPTGRPRTGTALSF